jgi:hypothetical protein
MGKFELDSSLNRLINMRNKYFYLISISILLIMLIIGLLITGNFYLAVGLVVVALIGFIIIILLLVYDNIGLLFKKIKSWVIKIK